MAMSDDRMLQLERLLLAQGGSSITYDAVGEPDQASVISELDRLGFAFRGCEMRGYAWEAEFRRPARDGGRPTNGFASAYSEHVAVIEAAIAALTTEEPARQGPNLRPPPGAWTTWRISRPAPRTPRFVPPAVSF